MGDHLTPARHYRKVCNTTRNSCSVIDLVYGLSELSFSRCNKTVFRTIQLAAVAVAHAKASRCEWLHVYFDPHLRDFNFGACGFAPTDARLIRLA